MNLPQKVEVIEVSPRDGFQNIGAFIPTELKIELIGKLIGCGFRSIEVTSFVHPKAVPQMSDAAEVLKAVREKYAGKVELIALVPNLFGAQRAIDLEADALTFVISASERHNWENTRQTIDQSLAAFTQVCKMKGNRKVRLGVATALDCPFTGAVPPEQAAWLVDAGLTAGADEILLADTTGSASPLQVEHLLQTVLPRYPETTFTLHLHDTHGMGLANALTALTRGISRLEAATAGLGGCPFAPGAAGNIATEDLVNMLHKMGIVTGLDNQKIMAAAAYMAEKLSVATTGHLTKAAACKLP